jgi:hypothetical protein
LGFAEGTLAANGWIVSQLHAGIHYGGATQYVHTGSNSDWFSVFPRFINLGDLAICELKQPIVTVCPNTLYSFGAWLGLAANSGGDANLTCVLTLSVNGVEVATGAPVTHTIGGGNTPWAQTTGYYLTGASETSVSIEVRRSCKMDGTASDTAGSHLDDITFTPVSPQPA